MHCKEEARGEHLPNGIRQGKMRLNQLSRNIGFDKLYVLIEQLEPRSRRILRLVIEGQRLVDIGTQESLSGERVRQIFIKSVSRILFQAYDYIIMSDRSKLLDRSIMETTLSNRAKIALYRFADIRTIRDLTRKGEAELMECYGVGRHTLQEIKDWLKRFDLYLSYETPTD